MQFLILAILFSSGVFVAMRLFDRFKIDSHQAIAINYAVAALSGFLMSGNIQSSGSIVDAPWFGLSLLTGFWFIFTYLLFAYSSPKAGVAITSMSSKLSVVIPTAVGIIFLKERLSLLAIIGIALAIVALCMVISKDTKFENKNGKTGWLIFLPLIIFFSTGLGDVMMKFTEQLNTGQDMTLMIAFIYFVALLFGILLVAVDYFRGKTAFRWKNVIGGIGLGLVNYFSTYCMYQCMRLFENVYLFPIYNIGVVCVTALIGLFVFKEDLSKKNYIGLALAVISVIIITFR